MNPNPGVPETIPQDEPATLGDLGDIIGALLYLLRRMEKRITMKISEATDVITAKCDQLEKAQTEIVAEIKKLQDATLNVDLPDAAVAAIDRLGAIAQGLDDINADPTPVDPGTGGTTPAPTTTAQAFKTSR